MSDNGGTRIPSRIMRPKGPHTPRIPLSLPPPPPPPPDSDDDSGKTITPLSSSFFEELEGMIARGLPQPIQRGVSLPPLEIQRVQQDENWLEKIAQASPPSSGNGGSDSDDSVYLSPYRLPRNISTTTVPRAAPAPPMSPRNMPGVTKSDTNIAKSPEEIEAVQGMGFNLAQYFGDRGDAYFEEEAKRHRRQSKDDGANVYSELEVGKQPKNERKDVYFAKDAMKQRRRSKDDRIRLPAKTKSPSALGRLRRALTPRGDRSGSI